VDHSLRTARGYYGLLITTVVVSFLCLAYPLYVIRPFRHQGPRELAMAVGLMRVRSPIEVACAVLAIVGLAWHWQREPRRLRRIAAIAGTFLVCAFAVLSRVNIDELMFHPDLHPTFAAVRQIKLDADDNVLAVKLGGNARAYPVRVIAYHHIINDLVGGVPIVATY
jgi:hypothetical protein